MSLVDNGLVAYLLGTADKLQGAQGLLTCRFSRVDICDDHALGIASQTVLHGQIASA